MTKLERIDKRLQKLIKKEIKLSEEIDELKAKYCFIKSMEDASIEWQDYGEND